jgi:hypothetical protein
MGYGGTILIPRSPHGDQQKLATYKPSKRDAASGYLNEWKTQQSSFLIPDNAENQLQIDNNRSKHGKYVVFPRGHTILMVMWWNYKRGNWKQDTEGHRTEQCSNNKMKMNKLFVVPIYQTDTRRAHLRLASQWTKELPGTDPTLRLSC